jgi:hypothetical protein
MDKSRNEIHELEERLHEKEMAVRGLEVAIMHHVQKVEEFEAILEAQGSDNELQSQLQAQALENANWAVEVECLKHQLKKSSSEKESLEVQLVKTSKNLERIEGTRLSHRRLLIEVEDLKGQLKNSSAERASLEVELAKASKKLKKMVGEHRSHQRLFAEMGDIVRMFERIKIESGSNNGSNESDWSDPERALDYIKLKVLAIEEDRLKIIQENQAFQSELFEKSIEIDSYRNESRQRQVEIDSHKNQSRQFKALNLDRDRLQLENNKLRQDCDEKGLLIKSLEKSVVNAKGVSETIPKSIEYEYQPVDQPDESTEVMLQDDGSTIVLPSMTSASRLTKDPIYYSLAADRDELTEEDVSFSSLESPEGVSEPLISGSVLKKSNNFYEEVLEKEVDNLKTELKKSRLLVKTAEKKQEMREKMLRDVIFQYKELQKEYDTTTTRLHGLEAELQGDRDPADDSSRGSSRDQRIFRGIHKKSTRKQSSSAMLEDESSTFDTAEMSAVASEPAQSLSAMVASIGSTGITGMQLGVPDSNDGRFRQLEKEAARLEHEYEDAIARIANIEEDLFVTKGELASVQARNILKENEFAELQHKYNHLQGDHQAAMEKTTQLQDDLEFAQVQARTARATREDRERDLWDVINQYKKLTTENEDKMSRMQGVESKLGQTQALMISVQQELDLTKRHIKRKDLVYDHMRMKQQIEDFKIQVETLERNLAFAKSDAARNKEESKGTRSRLVGCHFHHRKLQIEYNDMLVQKANIEKYLNSAKRELKTQRTQQGSWTERLSNLREKREEIALKNHKLLEENTELKAYCNELVTLASKSIKAL